MPRKQDGTQVLLSGLGAMNFGNDIGAGFSVTKMFPQHKPGMAAPHHQQAMRSHAGAEAARASDGLVPDREESGERNESGGGSRRDRREEVVRAGVDEDDVGGGEGRDGAAGMAAEGKRERAQKKPASFSFFATDTVEIRALCAKSGNHSLSLNANFGVMDNAA
mmetsp:Transcript_13670/g.31214  ORF Transcript_13670/g.31214 Transcript_13670/m.31214 type:complete len:164 (+) Transcript_13670:960-1451(+)